MKLLPNDSGENGVFIAVPKLGTGAAAWRMTQKELVYAGSVLYGGCVKKA